MFSVSHSNPNLRCIPSIAVVFVVIIFKNIDYHSLKKEFN